MLCHGPLSHQLRKPAFHSRVLHRSDRSVFTQPYLVKTTCAATPPAQEIICFRLEPIPKPVSDAWGVQSEQSDVCRDKCSPFKAFNNDMKEEPEEIWRSILEVWCDYFAGSGQLHANIWGETICVNVNPGCLLLSITQTLQSILGSFLHTEAVFGFSFQTDMWMVLK